MTSTVPGPLVIEPPASDEDALPVAAGHAIGDRLPGIFADDEIVLLHDMEGWKHREIAERLGIPSGTVRSHLHFARKSLRGSLSAVKEMEREE